MKPIPSSAAGGSPKALWLLTALIVFAFQLSPSLLACRYNVRDIGFVDDEGFPYHLCILYRSPHVPPPDQILRGRISEALHDTNIEVEWIDLAAADPHPSLSALGVDGATPVPQAMLRSPDGHVSRWSAEPRATANWATLPSFLDRVIGSAARDQLLKECIQSFGAILLLEGGTESENHTARKVIEAAIQAMRPQLQSLAKPIDNPPALVRLSRNAFPNESVLLWSLGLEPDTIRGTIAAVIYGKGRWIGPLMRGPEISAANIDRIFAIVGADCECGLDLTWTRGTQLPLRWTRTLYTDAVKQLGFDPENPLVKLEVGRILNRQGGPRRATSTADSGDEDKLSAGAGLASTPSVPSVSTSRTPATPADKAGRADKTSGQSLHDRRTPRLLAITLGSISLAAMVGAVLLWCRAKRKDP